MKSERHQQKKEEILDTAFKVWNANCYVSTSLNDIAEPLGMTKQAIYRYFKGKSGLITAMGERVSSDYSENFTKLKEELETDNRDKGVKAFIVNQLQFFHNHKEYLTFLISKIREADKSRGDFIKLIAEQNAFITETLSIPLIALNHILNIIVFYIFINEGETVEALAERINTIALEGFGTGLLKQPENVEQLIEENKLPEDFTFKDNKVLKAISEVVMEEGPHNASLDKIAKRAGMTKSSLYFYFKNKEEMIAETLNSQTELFTEYYHRKLSAYSDVGEQLFAHFVITASLSIEMPRTISLIHWFVQRGIGENFRKPTEFEKFRIFFENAVNFGYLDTHGVTADKLLLLVNFCVAFELNSIINKDRDKEEKYDQIISLFNLFAYGLNGLKS